MSIKNFEPTNDKNTLYIFSGHGGFSFDELNKSIRDHFGEDIDFDTLSIASEYIHTRCITYDLYDPADYDNYLVVSRNH